MSYDSTSYWQRKAIYENLSRNIPDFKDLKAGENKQYFDKEGALHFEVRVSSSILSESKFSGVIDYILGESTSKPLTKIIQESDPIQIESYVAFALLNSLCKGITRMGLNELFNNYNDVTLIDHKNNEVHRLTGTMDNAQLSYFVSHDLEPDLLSKTNSEVRFNSGEKFNRDYSDFLGKISPDFKARFAHEKTDKVIS